MSDLDNKDDDKKNENDPYDFFKLATDDQDDNDKDKKDPGKGHFPFWLIIVLIVTVLGIANMITSGGVKGENEVDFSTFRQLISNGKITEVELGENYFTGYEKAEEKEAADTPAKRFKMYLGQDQERVSYKTVGVLTEDFIKFLDDNNISYKFVRHQTNYVLQLFMNIIVPIAIILVIYFLIFRKMGSGGMGSVFSAGQSKAKTVEEGKVKTRFSDVAGVDEAKEELVEVVDFLKQPKKYTDIGGKIPKGVLLVGPPGTGKTLLARAVAGEAGVPFFRISGSDFVEMFVGVGASRVRDLFRQAREKAPCIIFIDEIDALGKSRANSYSSNDEREQTLNQLLVEMDGFDNDKGLIVLAATNRADILDAALLRPGRFDRQVPVEKPDVKGREEILRIHAKDVKIEDDVDFTSLAHGTIGFAGADLANVVNEAAILAVRNGRKKVTMEDFNDAIDKVSIGLKKKNKKENEKERRLVAYHETGHALMGAFTPDYPPVNKITVVPRSHGVGGFTQYREDEEKTLQTKQDLINEVDSLLGGRAAEDVIFGEISTGASNDIARATDILKNMITVYGMSDRFKNMTLGKGVLGNYSGEPNLIREFSEETQNFVDGEIARIMNERYEHAVDVLKKHKDLLDFVAKRLLEVETMDGKEFYDIVNNAKRCDEITEEAKKKTPSKKAAKAGTKSKSSAKKAAKTSE